MHLLRCLGKLNHYNLIGLGFALTLIMLIFYFYILYNILLNYIL
jgi:hypothetical protein